MWRILPAVLLALVSCAPELNFSCEQNSDCEVGAICQEGLCKGGRPGPGPVDSGPSCQAGFRPQGGGCLDIDECANGTHNCSPDATCTNTQGSFTCACRPGTTGEGKICTCNGCGDGFKCASEFCDDGFRDPCGTCNGNCTAAGNGQPHSACACADGTAEDVFNERTMGCAERVQPESRTNVCGIGWRVCTAGEWVARHGSTRPTHNYWVADNLNWLGNTEAECYATAEPGNTCGAGPMRICAGYTDPESNTCTWIDCGLESHLPNQYFGGCNGSDGTAGALCCAL